MLQEHCYEDETYVIAEIGSCEIEYSIVVNGAAAADCDSKSRRQLAGPQCTFAPVEVYLACDRSDATDEPKMFRFDQRTCRDGGAVQVFRDGPNTASNNSSASIVSNRSTFVRTSMKFIPPEEEIRAQLRELTSKTRRLRTDLQGLINDRGHSASAFSRDRRLRAKPEQALPVAPPSDQPANPPSQHQPSQSKYPKARRRR